MTQPFPFVSIIIPTFNDSEALECCLAALSEQTYPQECYEIIVINNNPSRPLQAFSQTPIIVLEEWKTGSYAARNCGVRAAKGEVLAFTDADCLPSSEWIQLGVENLLERPEFSLVAGNIEITLSSRKRSTPFELYELSQAFNQRQYVRRDKYAATANLFARKEVFESVGLFSEELKSGGDFEWGRRASAAGYSFLYRNDVKIYHPARKSLKEIIGKTRRIIGGHHVLMMKHLYPRSRFIAAIFVDFIFPYRSLLAIFKSERLDGFIDKLSALWASILVRYIRVFYRISFALQYQFSSRRA